MPEIEISSVWQSSDGLSSPDSVRAEGMMMLKELTNPFHIWRNPEQRTEIWATVTLCVLETMMN